MLAEIFGVDGIIVIICVVVVLLFGGTKLPKLARGLGSASHEFKKGLEEGDKEGKLLASDSSLPGTSSTPAVLQQPVVLPQAVPKDANTN